MTKNNATILSTHPLSEKAWQPIAFTRLTAFYNGKLIKTGINHEHEYIESEENMRMLYSIFANL